MNKSTKAQSAKLRVWFIAVGITAIATALRLYRLGDWSFWVDEMFTLVDVTHGGSLGRYHGMTYPLSYILIGLSIDQFGISEWSARIIPALFGIVTPVIVYLLSRRIFGETAAIAGAVIVAISPWHLYWSQMARFYTMTVFFSSVSLLVLHKGLEEGRRSWIGASGILMALGVLSHYSAFLVLAAVAVYVSLILLLRWPRPKGLTLINSLLYLAPFILGAILLGSRAHSLLAKYAGGHPTGTHIVDPVHAAAYMIFSIGYRLEPVVALFAVVGIWIGLRRRDRGALLLTTAVVIPTLLMIIAGMLSHAENRYAFVILPAGALLAGLAVAGISDILWPKAKALAVVTLLALTFPLIQHDALYFSSVYNGERWNYRGAAQYIKEHAEPGDRVYAAMWTPLAHYLKDSGITAQDLTLGTDDNSLPGSGAWIVMEDDTRGKSASTDMSDWINHNCSLEAHFPASSPVTNYGLSVYRRR